MIEIILAMYTSAYFICRYTKYHIGIIVSVVYWSVTVIVWVYIIDDSSATVAASAITAKARQVVIASIIVGITLFKLKTRENIIGLKKFLIYGWILMLVLFVIFFAWSEWDNLSALF